MTTLATAVGKFVWHEQVSPDPKQAQELGPEYGGYRIFNRGDTGIAGVMSLPDDSIPPHWQPYVAVPDDPDRTTANAIELGGSALTEPMDVPTVGRIAVLRDRQGATFGIVRPQPAS